MYYTKIHNTHNCGYKAKGSYAVVICIPLHIYICITVICTMKYRRFNATYAITLNNLQSCMICLKEMDYTLACKFMYSSIWTKYKAVPISLCYQPCSIAVYMHLANLHGCNSSYVSICTHFLLSSSLARSKTLPWWPHNSTTTFPWLMMLYTSSVTSTVCT